MRLLLLLIASGGALLVLGGFAGAFHRAADTLALGRPAFGLLALLGVFVARRRVFRAVFAGITMAALASVMVVFLPQHPGGDLRVYSKNLMNDWVQEDPLVADIRAQVVDVVFLQEVSDGNRVLFDRLSDRFPHQHLCRFSAWSGIAIASKHPFDGPPECSDLRSIAAAPVRIDGQKIWLVSAHIPWLWPSDTAAAEAAGRAYIETLDAPAVMAGDFNTFPWTPRVRWFAARTGTQLAGPTPFTLSVFTFLLPLDFAMAPGGGSLERRPRFGSDHHGIIADVALTP